MATSIAASTSAPPHTAEANGFSGDRLSEDQLRHCSVAVKFFEEKLSNLHNIHNEFEEILKESDYEHSKTELVRATKCTIAAENNNKNRYPRAVPYDGNRIILKGHEGYTPPPKGYINASPITASKRFSQFIASQGPKPETFEDFWEMILQHQVSAIIMLTNLVDLKGNVLCGDYFQEKGDGGKEFGNIRISTKWTQITDSAITLRCIEVKNKESKKTPHSVLHILYPNWPDEGVPADASIIREIYRIVSAGPSSLGPIVVHCSAGIGRAGTYCVVHNTIQRVLDGDMTALDVAATVATFRSKRLGMVQKPVQYVFCYKAILAELKYLQLNARANAE